MTDQDETANGENEDLFDKTPPEENDTTIDNENQAPAEEHLQDELTLLKERAKLMGIGHHPNIGVEKLRERINAALAGETPKEPEPAKGINPEKLVTKKKTQAEILAQRNNRLRKEARRLIRIQLTCMDPSRKNWPGKIYTVSNAIIGTISKFVPYTAVDGYHVPHVIYEQMKMERYQAFKTVKLPNGRKVQRPYLAKTYAIEILDPLTPAQLKDLADRQALNHSID